MTSSTTATFQTHSLTIELPLDVADALAETHEDGLEGAAIAALQLWLKIGTQHLNIAKGYAIEHGISQHAAIKKAIAKQLDERQAKGTTTMPLKQVREARDADVYRRAMLGVKRHILAKEYQLSEVRVHQIISAGKRDDPKRKPATTAKREELLREWDEPEGL
jgi:Mor family transcriptional regulator